MKCRFINCDNEAEQSIRPYVYNNMCQSCFNEYMEILEEEKQWRKKNV